MRTRHLLALLPLAAAGCGGPLFSVGATAQRVCVVQTGEQIDLSQLPELPPLAGLPTIRVSGSVERTFDVDTSQLPDLTKEGVTADLRLVSFRLKAPTLLPGVDHVRVELLPPAGSTLPAVTLVDVTHAEAATGEVTVDLSSTGTDLVRYLTSGQRVQVRLDAQATVDLDPSTARQAIAEVELCTTADASFDYGRELGL